MATSNANRTKLHFRLWNCQLYDTAIQFRLIRLHLITLWTVRQIYIFVRRMTDRTHDVRVIVLSARINMFVNLVTRFESISECRVVDLQCTRFLGSKSFEYVIINFHLFLVRLCGVYCMRLPIGLCIIMLNKTVPIAYCLYTYWSLNYLGII